MKNYKTQQSKEQKVKRVLIERADGTIAYDGKPDLCVFYAANADKKTFDSMEMMLINEDGKSAAIIKDAIEKLEKIISKLAMVGLIVSIGAKQ